MVDKRPQERKGVLYVVSGFMRTGTSMMMRALEAGGLEACYKQSREVMRKRFADDHYDPNIGGLYELEAQDYRAWAFPRLYAGKLIKALNRGVPRMAVMPGGIRVVFMWRHSEEIRQSFAAFFGKQLDDPHLIERKMRDCIERIQNRKDVLSVDTFKYRKVVEQPRAHFEILRDHGWPINPSAAAAIVDPQYCRFKLEELEIGIV